MPTSTPVSHVSDTARLVAAYRAMETARPDALFRDPFAAKLAGPEGEKIVDGMVNGRKLAWPMITRTAVMDEIIQRVITNDGVDTVLNLAAGLDTRAYRMGLPKTLQWVDADLPDVLSYRKEQLIDELPTCTYALAAVDLTDADARRRLFAEVDNEASNTLIVTEGLLVYLTPEQVEDLARDLHAQSSFNRWLIDIASPRLLKMLEKTWGKQLRDGNAPMLFAPPEGTEFFEPCGWHEVEYRPMFDESVRLKRSMRFARFWQLLGRLAPKKRREEFRRMSGIVLLERSAP